MASIKLLAGIFIQELRKIMQETSARPAGVSAGIRTIKSVTSLAQVEGKPITDSNGPSV
jgi:hypothetical protein